MKVAEITFGYKLKADVLKCDPQAFVDKVIEISRCLYINPHWLMVVMELETAGTFDPAITNSLGYTGLIQFGTAAAADLSITTAQLRKMNALEQLDYVYRYLKPYTRRMQKLADVYLAVFFPRAIGRHDGWVLQTARLSPERIAKWNPGFDVDKNKQIQIWEIKQKVIARVRKDQLKNIA
ncbi:hypothetical protein [Leeuwenhoekiella marinoflava]|uniref:Transglycosylase-like protein with SLT domain n=2 Tax=Leeuwenhoekiella marinoflava TaxID=988 RepID=A0A4Q0PN98_9FLAO|nr:hypothetical protein [Leeuwenhoekiella marinoflava]RXG32036.1 hypothetical protein DSL99_1341 [Leeuwenhoekiella marinoflava]SHE95742.1 hypothetical protein SAMN02745246_01396 [Leeuwenhoekiella marinoflava DSM 3653]